MEAAQVIKHYREKKRWSPTEKKIDLGPTEKKKNTPLTLLSSPAGRSSLDPFFSFNRPNFIDILVPPVFQLGPVFYLLDCPNLYGSSIVHCSEHGNYQVRRLTSTTPTNSSFLQSRLISPHRPGHSLHRFIAISKLQSTHPISTHSQPPKTYTTAPTFRSMQ